MTEEEHSTDRREGQEMTKAQRYIPIHGSYSNIAKSLCLLAKEQSKPLQLVENQDESEETISDETEHEDDACCITSKTGKGDLNIVSLRYNVMYSGMHNESSIEDQHAEGGELTSNYVVHSMLAEETDTSQQHLVCHAVMNAVMGVGERQGTLKDCSVYCRNKPCAECQDLLELYDCDTTISGEEFERELDEVILVNLDKCKCYVSSYSKITVDAYAGTAQLQSGSSQSKQSFFPLAIDDYFMAVAILTGRDLESKGSCCVIVTHEPPCVVSSSAKTKCPERCAVSHAHRSQVDLTKCILYTTKSPCLECTKIILQAGIRVVVHGRDFKFPDLVYQTKACFKKYRCHIRVADKKKRFLINLKECKVHPKILKYEGPPQTLAPAQLGPTHTQPGPAENNGDMKKPTYRDFFMAMAFLASARSKDQVTQVGACLVTQAPHRLVAMGYNGMPDGRGFKDEKMDWGSNQSNYICHAELNAIIAAFRRMAGLSSCTLYVTHSPCEDCSKLIAQSGIKNVVFTKYYKEGKHLYKQLGHLPDMNITHYEYKNSGYGNGAAMTIDLEGLKVTITESTKAPAPTTAPKSVRASATSSGITVEWEPLDCHCNGDITDYSVQCEEKDGRDKQEQHDIVPRTWKATFGCLIPSTTYNFRVAAINSSGTGVYSDAASIETKPDRYASNEHYTVKGRRDVDFPLDDYFMALAVLATVRSPYPELKRVGACIVLQEPRRAISVGYNGPPDGLKDIRDDFECCAEHNAIVSAFRYHADLTNCILYTTAPPCYKCAQMIVQSGIKTVVHGKGSKPMSDEIFYWAKVATLHYEPLTTKKIITIDLLGQTVVQTE